jgi:hypothetical protein
VRGSRRPWIEGRLAVDKKKVPMVPVVEFDLDDPGPIRLSSHPVGVTENEYYMVMVIQPLRCALVPLWNHRVIVSLTPAES